MGHAARDLHDCCLTYCAISYSGIGWPQTCVSILEGFAGGPLRPVLAVPRARAPLPRSIEVVCGLRPPASALPWRYVAGMGGAALERRFAALIDRADPATSMAYFWPGAPLPLVERARVRGLMTVREMINTFQGTAKRILDGAYQQAGLPAAHTITPAAVEAEQRELPLFDHICAPSPLVADSLREAGIAPTRIIATSFGWAPARFAATTGTRHPPGPRSAPVKLLFVGLVGVRKGVPDLLAAWARSGIRGTLTLVGDVEPAVMPLIERARQAAPIEILPFRRNVGALYRSHDIFVFPTHEEGAPQVIFEAGGCGMPIITTPMGAARLVRDGVNGMVVPAGAPDELAAAMAALAADPALRLRYGSRVAADAPAFTYDRLGAERAAIFHELLQQRARTG